MIKNILCMLLYDRVSPYMGGERERRQTFNYVYTVCGYFLLPTDTMCVCVFLLQSTLPTHSLSLPAPIAFNNQGPSKA